MHLSHLPQSLILILLALAPTAALARPDPRPQQIILDRSSPEDRQRRLEAWKAQKPMHTTALLAGAAATAVPKALLRDGRRRDLSGVTGEKGIWIPVEFWDDGDEVGEYRRPRSGDVRGEKVVEAELESELQVEVEGEVEDEDGEMEMEVYGVRDVLDGWWRNLEKVGLVVQRKFRQMEKVRKLGDGHDGDL